MKKKSGLILVYTGNGKGKTTAALGTVVRGVGYGRKTCMVQFIKGDWKYGEIDGLARLAPDVELHRMGKGFYKILGDDLPEEIHREAAESALDFACKKMCGGAFDLMILDEVLVAVHSGLLKESALLDFMDKKPESVDLILTGRNAGKLVMERADLVTEMREIKHPFQKGIMAKKGIDY